jgi:hypothetical protein
MAALLLALCLLCLIGYVCELTAFSLQTFMIVFVFIGRSIDILSIYSQAYSLQCDLRSSEHIDHRYWSPVTDLSITNIDHWYWTLICRSLNLLASGPSDLVRCSSCLEYSWRPNAWRHAQPKNQPILAGLYQRPRLLWYTEKNGRTMFNNWMSPCGAIKPFIQIAQWSTDRSGDFERRQNTTTRYCSVFGVCVPCIWNCMRVMTTAPRKLSITILNYSNHDVNDDKWSIVEH